MRIRHRLRTGVVSSALGLGALALAVSLVWAVPGAKAASGAANVEATEMVRLINGVRSAEGKPALRVDPFLAKKASDGDIACPDDASQSVEGRAKDFATYDYMSHSLRLCGSSGVELSSVKFVSMVGSAYGYWNVGEIDLANGGYGTGKYLLSYTASAAPHQTWYSWTYATTGHGILGWLSSSSHRAIVMGTYDRVGCGAWLGSTGKFYYDCVFSKGGASPNGTVAPPTTSPFSDPVPTPVATPTKVPTPVPTPRPTPRPTRVPAPVSPKPTVRTTAAPIATATSTATAVQASDEPTARPTLGSDPAASSTPLTGAQVVNGASSAPWVAAAVGPSDITSDGGWSAGLSPLARGLVGAVLGALAAILAASYAALLALRRRRRQNLDVG